MPGVETRTMLIYSEGVAKGLITPNRFVRVCASNPAKLFGIYPKKGAIQPGSDADLIIIEPNRKSRVTVDDLHENVDYTPYEGFEITGRIEYTIARGEIIAQDGNFIGKKGRGEFLPRNIPALALA